MPLHDQQQGLVVGAFVAAERLRRARSDLVPDLSPHDGGWLAKRLRVLAAEDRPVRIVVQVDQPFAQPDEHRLARREDDADQRGKAARPGCCRAEAGCGSNRWHASTHPARHRRQGNRDSRSVSSRQPLSRPSCVRDSAVGLQPREGAFSRAVAEPDHPGRAPLLPAAAPAARPSPCRCRDASARCVAPRPARPMTTPDRDAREWDAA